MPSTKIVTFLLGLMLIVPLAASFWTMIRYRPPSEVELQKSLGQAMAAAKAYIDAQVTPGFPVILATKVEIHNQSTLPFVSPRIWLLRFLPVVSLLDRRCRKNQTVGGQLPATSITTPISDA